MKIRKGFVSNSSSTSFTCDVCGSEESGMDMWYGNDDYGSGMFKCENGHVVCYDHEIFLSNEEKRKVLKRLGRTTKPDEDLEDAWYEIDAREYPIKCCPICQFVSSDSKELYKWLLIRGETNEVSIRSEIANRFGNDYKAFQEFLKED